MFGFVQRDAAGLEVEEHVGVDAAEGGGVAGFDVVGFDFEGGDGVGFGVFGEH